MDISDILLPVKAHSAIFYLRDDKGAFIKEKGKKIGIELWARDSKAGIRAQIAADRFRANLHEELKGLPDDEALVEKVFAATEINRLVVQHMFKGVIGELTLGGEPITTENIGDVLPRLKPEMIKEMVEFTQSDKNYLGKP